MAFQFARKNGKIIPKNFIIAPADRIGQSSSGNWISSFLFKRQKLLSHFLITQLPIKAPNYNLADGDRYPRSERGQFCPSFLAGKLKNSLLVRLKFLDASMLKRSQFRYFCLKFRSTYKNMVFVYKEDP